MSAYTNNSSSYTNNPNNTGIPPSNTQQTSGMRGGTNAGATTGRKIEGVLSGIHGAGEQIRGQFNMAVDTVMRDREGQARNQGIIDRGREEYNTGRIIDNPEKRRYARETYPSTGDPMAGPGTGNMGTGNAGMGNMETGHMGTGRTTDAGMHAGSGTMGPGGTMGSGRTTGSVTANMPQGVRLTEGSYGERGPTNAGVHPGGTHTTGGPAVGGGHYVNESGRRV